MSTFAYADPPYPGQSAKHYSDHPDYAGEVDSAQMLDRLVKFDGWALSTHVAGLYEFQALLDRDHGMLPNRDYRVCAWTKPFAALKRNVKVAYAWEPLLVHAIHKPDPTRLDSLICRDYLSEPITMRRGLVGAKPERFCWWLFEIAGLAPDDDLLDLFPGSGAVTAAHRSWRRRISRTVEPLSFDLPPTREGAHSGSRGAREAA